MKRTPNWLETRRREKPRDTITTEAVLSVVILFITAAAFAGCGGSGGGGGGGVPAQVLLLADDGDPFPEQEPNDTPAFATDLPLQGAGIGEATVGDIDFWAFTARAGDVVQLRVLGVRFDQAGWDANDNVPELALFDKDGVTLLCRHDPDGIWGWGKHDLDTPRFRIPTDGVYFACVTLADAAIAGGKYAILVRVVEAVDHEEGEASGVSGDNDTIADAEAISDGILYGFHVDGEDDFYALEVEEASIVRVELEAYRNGITDGGDYYDPKIALHDSGGVDVLADNDDAFFFDSALRYLIMTADTYSLQVYECCGTGDSPYFLHVETTPVGVVTEDESGVGNDSAGTADAMGYDTVMHAAMDAGDEDWFSFSGTTGDLVHVGIYHDGNHQDATERVTVEIVEPDQATTLLVATGGDLSVARAYLRKTGTHYIHVTPDSGPTDYALHLERFLDGREEAEPNEVPADASVLDDDGRAAGVIADGADVDTFSFSVSTSRLVTALVYAGAASGSNGSFTLSGGSTLVPVLRIRDELGTVLAESNPLGVTVFPEGVIDSLPTVQVAFVAPAAGDYYVEVVDALGTGSPDHRYLLEVR